MATVPWDEHLSTLYAQTTRKVTDCAKACSDMASHVVVEVWRLQQLALEEVVSVEGIRQGGGSKGWYIRCQLASVHQDCADYVRANSSAKRRETLLPYHLQSF